MVLIKKATKKYNRILLHIEQLLISYKYELFEVDKSGKKQENVGNSYFIPAPLLYRIPTL